MIKYTKPKISSIKSHLYFLPLTQTGAFLFTTNLVSTPCCEQENPNDTNCYEPLSPFLASIQVSDGQICISGELFGTNCGPIDNNGNFTVDILLNDGNCTIAQDSCCFRIPNSQEIMAGNFNGSHIDGTLTRVESPATGSQDPDCGQDNGCEEISRITADPA